MPAALRSAPTALLSVAAILAVLTGILGYVYSHEPARDLLAVEFTGSSSVDPAAPQFLSGVVVSADAETLRLITPAGLEQTVPRSGALLIEDLVRLDAPPTDGTWVNVGVDDTSFGQVLTGVVAVDQTP